MRHLHLVLRPDRALFSALDDEFLPERVYITENMGRVSFHVEGDEHGVTVESTLPEAKKKVLSIVGTTQLLKAVERIDMPRGEILEVQWETPRGKAFAGEAKVPGRDQVIVTDGVPEDQAQRLLDEVEEAVHDLFRDAIRLYHGIS